MKGKVYLGSSCGVLTQFDTDEELCEYAGTVWEECEFKQWDHFPTELEWDAYMAKVELCYKKLDEWPFDRLRASEETEVE